MKLYKQYQCKQEVWAKFSMLKMSQVKNNRSSISEENEWIIYIKISNRKHGSNKSTPKR